MIRRPPRSTLFPYTTALPILWPRAPAHPRQRTDSRTREPLALSTVRSEEHTSELQSHHDLVCRLLLEKKKNKTNTSNQEHKTRTKQTRQSNSEQIII